MDVQRDIFGFCVLRTPAQSLLGDGVDRVRGNTGQDSFVVSCLQVFDRLLHDPLFGLKLFGVSVVNHTVREAGTDAGLLNCVGCRVHHEVHVVKGGCSGPDHLQAGESYAGVDVRLG